VLELVKDKKTRQSFSDAECNWLLRDQLSPRIYRKGLICRADDRADPVLVLSPTLVCGPDELRFIGRVLTEAITETAEAYASS
jgi:adenosylmethionine-8-amino-7-oxononanoate aminotransferase